MIPDGRAISYKWKIEFYPTNIIVDQKGKIQFYKLGSLGGIEERMSSKIDKLLK